MSLFDDLPEETSKTTNPSRISEEDTTSVSAEPVVGSKRKSDGGEIGDCDDLLVKRLKKDDFIILQSFGHGRKGERDEMQDHHVMIDDLLNHSKEKVGMERLAYFAVFDGHAGARASEYAAQKLHKLVLENLPVGSPDEIEKGMKKTFVKSFKALDDEFLEQASKQRPVWKDGTTATVLLIVNNTLYVANIGDSKAILVREDESGRKSALTLTKDHEPTVHEERMRIQKAGATVRNGRVNGILEVSRSFGDGYLKNHGVTCLPDVRKCLLGDKDRYMLIACDGLWKSFSNEDVLKFIDEFLPENQPKCTNSSPAQYESLCSRLSAEAVKRLSGDNVTVLFVKLGPNS